MNNTKKIGLFTALTAGAVIAYKAYKWFTFKPEETKEEKEERIWNLYMDNMAERCNFNKPLKHAIQKVGVMKGFADPSKIFELHKELEAARLANLNTEVSDENKRLFEEILNEFASIENEEDLKKSIEIIEATLELEKVANDTAIASLSGEIDIQDE